MSDWRAKATATAEMEKDLTDGTVFDWVGYLKSHRDIANIVPNGRVVVNFAIVRLAVIDKIHKVDEWTSSWCLTMAIAFDCIRVSRKKQFPSSCLQMAWISS